MQVQGWGETSGMRDSGLNNRGAKKLRDAGSSGRPPISLVVSYMEGGSLHLGAYADCIILVRRTQEVLDTRGYGQKIRTQGHSR